MRPGIIICISIFIIVSCAKKTVPAASTETNTTSTSVSITTPAANTTTPVTESNMSIAGHATYDAKCGRCHNLKRPNEYTAERWVPIMNDMAVRARLDSTEKANVLAYVTFHAKTAN